MWVIPGQSLFVRELEFYGDNKKSVVSNMPPEIVESSQIVVRFTWAVPTGTYIFGGNSFASPKLLVFFKNIGLFETCNLSKNRWVLKLKKDMNIVERGSIG